MNFDKELRFSVSGTEPRPQGSKDVGRNKAGQAYVYEAGSAKLKPWRKLLKEAAESAAKDQGWIKTEEPVKVIATFRFPVVKSDDSRFFAWSKFDLDKLQRALGDALKDAGIVKDDNRICAWDALKIHAEVPGVSVAIREIA